MKKTNLRPDEMFISDIESGKINCYFLDGSTYKNYPKHVTANHNADVSRLTLKRLYIEDKKFSIERLNNNNFWIVCRSMTHEEESYVRALAIRELDKKRQERLEISMRIIERFENK